MGHRADLGWRVSRRCSGRRFATGLLKARGEDGELVETNVPQWQGARSAEDLIGKSALQGNLRLTFIRFVLSHGRVRYNP